MMKTNLVLIEARRFRKSGRAGKSKTLIKTSLFLVADGIAADVIADLAAKNKIVAASDEKLTETYQISDIRIFQTMEDYQTLVVDKERDAALEKLTDKERAMWGLPLRKPVELVQDTVDGDADEDTADATTADATA